MANKFDVYPAASADDEQGFLVRDLVRFFIVDLIIVASGKLLLALGVFINVSSYVLALLAGKGILLLYLIWLIRDRREAWRETGILSPGRWWTWPASMVLYAAAYPVAVWFQRLNHLLLDYLYHLAGWTYEPTIQDVIALIFERALDTPTRLSLLFFAVIAGPFMEELAFRGMGMDGFRRVFGSGGAFFLTSFLFGLYHFNITLLLPLSLMGAIFAAVRVMSQSLWCAIAVHCFHNAVAIAIAAHEFGFWKLPG